MNKISVILLTVLFFSTALFASDKKTYIANLDPAKDETTIVQAADWLGEKKESDAVSKLVELLADSRDMVRLHCVMALGYIGEDDSVEAINNVLLSDKNATVRYAALLSTVRIGSKKSIPVWEKAKTTETDPYIKDFLTKMDEKAKGK